MIHPKMKVWLSFTHLHVIQNLHDFLANTKEDNLKDVSAVFVHTIEVNVDQKKKQD